MVFWTGRRTSRTFLSAVTPCGQAWRARHLGTARAWRRLARGPSGAGCPASLHVRLCCPVSVSMQGAPAPPAHRTCSLKSSTTEMLLLLSAPLSLRGSSSCWTRTCCSCAREQGRSPAQLARHCSLWHGRCAQRAQRLQACQLSHLMALYAGAAYDHILAGARLFHHLRARARPLMRASTTAATPRAAPG